MTPQIAEVYGRASVNMHPLGVTGRYVTLNLHDNILCVVCICVIMDIYGRASVNPEPVVSVPGRFTDARP
jgi:hypothetical protein